MFWNKEKKLFNKWLEFAVNAMSEHDRTYQFILTSGDIEAGIFEAASKYIDVDPSMKKKGIDTESFDFVWGKHLFRTFAIGYVQLGGVLEKKLSYEKIDELCKRLDHIAMFGTDSLEPLNHILIDEGQSKNIDFKSLQVQKHKFTQEFGENFANYCKQNNNSISETNMVSSELVSLYCQALRFAKKDLNEKDMMPKAMMMFEGARKAILERI